MNKAQVATALIAIITTELLAPLLAVFVLDENCLRAYLFFAPDLKSVLDLWYIGMKGADAYRTGFCLQQLTMQFSYVWITKVAMSALLAPAIELVKSNKIVTGFQNKIVVGLKVAQN